MSNTLRSLLIKVGVDLSQYTTSINDLKKQQTEVENKFRTGANAMENWQSTSAGLSLKVGALNDKIGIQKRILNELQLEMKAVADAGYKESDAYTTLQKQYNTQSGQLDRYQKELNTTQKELYETAVAEGKTGAEATAMGGKIKAAASSTSSMKSQIKNFASSSLLQFASITGAVALAKDAFQALAKLISDSAQWADDLTTLARKTDISTKALQGMQYASYFVDVDMNTMTSSMAKFTKSMGIAADGNKDLQKVFKDQLGIDIEVNGKLRDRNDVFAEAIDALGTMTNATERDVLAQKLFGKSAADLNPLITAGGGALKKYAKEAQDMGVIVDRGSVAVLSRLQNEFDKTQSVADATGRRFAASMAPVSQFFDNIWRDTLKSIDPTNNYTTAIYNTAIANGASADEAQKLVDRQNLAQEALYVTGSSVDVYKAKLAELTTFYTEQGIPVAEADLLALNNLADGYDLAALKTQEVMTKQEELADATQIALDEYNKASDDLKKAIEDTTKKYLGQMGGIFDKFEIKLDTSKKSLKKIKDEIIGNLEDQVEGFQTWSTEIGKLSKRGVDDGMVAELRQLGVKALPQIQAMNTMTDKELTKTVGLYRDKNRLAKEEAVKELEPMKKEVVTKLKAVEDAISAQDKQWKEAGADLATALANGIDQNTWKIKKEAIEAAKAAFQGAKDWLGQKSPTGKFRDEIGKNIPLAVALGISENTKAAMNASKTMAGSVYGAFDGSMSLPMPSYAATISPAIISESPSIKSSSYKVSSGSGAARAVRSAVIPLYINGKEFAKATVDDIDAAQSAKATKITRAGG
jgi:hypothetical protein